MSHEERVLQGREGRHLHNPPDERAGGIVIICNDSNIYNSNNILNAALMNRYNALQGSISTVSFYKPTLIRYFNFGTFPAFILTIHHVCTRISVPTCTQESIQIQYRRCVASSTVWWASGGSTERGRASGPAWRLPLEEVVFLRAIPAIAAAAAVWMNA